MMQAVPNEDRDQFKSIVAEVAPGLAKERGFVHQAFANFVAGSNELSGSAIGLARKGLSATRGAVAERVYGRGSQAAESEKAFLAQREKDRWDAGLADDFVKGAAQAQEDKSMANDSLALQFAKSAVFGIARAVPMMAAGGAVGTSLSPLTFFPQMQQEQEKKFRQEGHSEKWATIMSVPVGIVQAFIEKAGGNSTLAKNMKGQILKGAGNRIKQAIKTAGGEWGEEALQGAVSELGSYMLGFVEPEVKKDWTAKWKAASSCAITAWWSARTAECAPTSTPGTWWCTARWTATSRARSGWN